MRGLNGEITLVFKNEKLQGDTIANQGLQFLKIHLDGTVAGNADGAPMVVGERCTNGGRKSVAHRGTALISKDADALVHLHGLISTGVGSTVARHYHITVVQLLEQLVGKLIGIGITLTVGIVIEQRGQLGLYVATPLAPFGKVG